LLNANIGQQSVFTVFCLRIKEITVGSIGRK